MRPVLDLSWPTSWHVLGEHHGGRSRARDNMLQTATKNSLILTVASVTLLVVLCSMAGFVLERRRDRMPRSSTRSCSPA